MKQIMLRLTLAQRMIAEIKELGNFDKIGGTLMSVQELEDTLAKAYSELNVFAMRGETDYIPPSGTIMPLKAIVKELK